MKAREFCLALCQSIKKRKDIVIKRYRLRYKKGKYDFIKILSRKIEPEDKVILIRAGIHGDEIAGPLTILSFCNEIIDYVHRAGLKCIIYPLGNPPGFEKGKRYHFKGREGNNDFIRYELEDGRTLGELVNGAEYKKWRWSSDIKWYWDKDFKLRKVRLPQETRLMHKILRNDPLSQIAAMIDLHQDCISEFPAVAYHYAFGDLSCYRGIVEKIEEIVSILRNTEVSAGQSYPEKSNSQGFIVRHDGTLPDLMYRLGVKYCVTVETTGVTPLDIACQVNLIWLSGIIDLVKS